MSKFRLWLGNENFHINIIILQCESKNLFCNDFRYHVLLNEYSETTL